MLVCCAAIFNFCRITGNMKLCIIKSNDYLSSPFWPPPSQTRTAIKNGSKYEHARTHTHTHRHIHMYACLAGTPLTTSSSVYCCAMKIRNEKFIRRIKRSAIESHLCYLFLIHDTPPRPLCHPLAIMQVSFCLCFYAPTNCHRYICCVQHCV